MAYVFTGLIDAGYMVYRNDASYVTKRHLPDVALCSLMQSVIMSCFIKITLSATFDNYKTKLSLIKSTHLATLNTCSFQYRGTLFISLLGHVINYFNRYSLKVTQSTALQLIQFLSPWLSIENIAKQMPFRCLALGNRHAPERLLKEDSGGAVWTRKVKVKGS